MKLKALPIGLAAVVLGVGVAACGGGGSTAAGIVTAPSDGLTATVPSNIPTSVATPTTGALAKEPNVPVPSGAAPKKLTVKTITPGTGQAVKAGDTVFVNYVGKVYSTGKVFDASWKDTPGKTYPVAKIGQAQVIAGWNKGLIGLKQGGRYELIIPPSDAYGSEKQAKIPANSTLVFVIDVVKVYSPSGSGS
jgi:peptidylprolyl isomerase